MLASLYFAQGLPFGYFTLILPNLLRERGGSLIAVGLSSGVAAPWALKFLWAPLVDRYGSITFGRRKSWIVPLQIAMMCLLTALAFLPESAPLAVLAGGVLAANFLAATQDIATDGLAIDILDPHERGFANGIQVGGYRAGMILGGSAIVIVSVRVGSAAAFLAMAALLLAASMPVLFAKERAVRAAPTLTHPAKNPLRARHFLRRDGAWRLLALIFVYKLGDAFATAMIKPFVRDRGFSLEDQALLLSTYGSIAGMVGAFAGGALIRPLGRRCALTLFGAMQILTLGAYTLSAAGAGGRSLIYAATTLEHLVSGMATAALFTVMMDACRSEQAATDYTVQASAFVIAGGTAQLLSGFFAEPLGYFAHFGASTLLAAASVPAAFFLCPRLEPRGAEPLPAGT